MKKDYKKIIIPLIIILIILAIVFWPRKSIEINNGQSTNVEELNKPSEDKTEKPIENPVVNQAVEPVETEASVATDDSEHPKAPRLDYIETLVVPEYSGEPYIIINEGLPFFDTKTLKPESYEIYYDLDELGRCTLADAVVGRDLMPTQKRGSISSVKPTGWHSVKYPQELVDGESLYNRCHLIAFGLCGEEANPYNLVTGTRYFNTKGVNDFENMVIDYIRETGNHVRYRVTPVWTGDNLVCDGQTVEAWSIEDEGEAICFNIYAYNVQPGIHIDYATGDNWLEGEIPTKKEEVSEPSFDSSYLLAVDYEGDFVLNIKSKKFHTSDCEGVSNMSKKNRQDYHGSYNDLILKGYTPDYYCLLQDN